MNKKVLAIVAAAAVVVAGGAYLLKDNKVESSYSEGAIEVTHKLGTTVSELKKENNLTSNTLQIGEVLRVPTKEIYEEEENIYIVKKGDTLYSIPMANNTTVDELKKANNLTSNILSTGQ